MLFCSRCDRSYDSETLRQKENWAWTPSISGGFKWSDTKVLAVIGTFEFAKMDRAAGMLTNQERSPITAAQDMFRHHGIVPKGCEIDV